jgi:hypothetical protein
MRYIIVAVIGAALFYFGGLGFGLYEESGPAAPLIGAAVGAAVLSVLALALTPRTSVVYKGPAFD